MIRTDTTRPKKSAPLTCAMNAPRGSDALIEEPAPSGVHYPILGSQGKLGKDAVSEVCSAHERSRTQIQRRHAGSGSYAIYPLDNREQDHEHRDPDQYRHHVHTLTILDAPSRPHDDSPPAYNDFVTLATPRSV
jgi:hypothetical protein